MILMNGKIFVSKDYDRYSPMTFACTLKDHSPNSMLIHQAKKYNCWKLFIDNYKMGNVYFESQDIKFHTTEVMRLFLSRL